MEEIAIIGIGCKFPGADNIDEFWRVLKNGENHVLEVPRDRWNLDAFYDPDPNAPGKTYVRRAGFIKKQEEWDNKVYGVNDFEASQMDPQQRFVMDCCYRSMENAGITRKQLDGSKTGVFIGVMNSDYKALQSTSSEHMNNYTLTGTSTSIIASRVSFNYNLVGPSLTLDTACSSSLLAIHLAANSLVLGDCDLAFAGGVNSLMSPGIFVQLSKARMASPTGYCQAFSNKADGYARGEGAGIILLKRLKDAERDNDPIWATIMTGCNQDGHTVTPMTAPSGSQQLELLKSIYTKYNIDPDQLEYIEAHGTGTQAGDPVEANCLGGFLSNHTQNAPRYIGSVKTNIGHLESAAGVAGVIKVLLMQKHSTIVPNLHFDRPNEKIDFERLKLIVATRLDNWPSYTEDGSKLSCVNSFSFGGTNCHAVIKSYVKPKAKNEVKFGMDKSHLICFSGMDEWSVKASVNHFIEQSKSRSYVISDVSFTSTVKRDHYPIRHAVVVETMEDAVNQLTEVTPTPVPARALQKAKKVIFVFGGMGSTWRGMCKEMMTNTIFTEKVAEIDGYLEPLTGWSIKQRFQEDFDPTDPYFGPIASFTCQVALDSVWKRWGVTPDCIIGQSIGEVAAAHAAGALSLKAAVDVIYHRTYQQAVAVGGSMLVVGNHPVSEVERLLSEFPGKIVVAVHNSPRSCTLSGDTEAIQAVKQRLEDANDGQILLRPLQVTSAFHSHHMEECSKKIKSCLSDLQGAEPTVKLYSTVSAREASDGDFVSGEYWAKNVREPVLFRQALQDAVDPNCFNVFLEIGSKPVLRAHAKDNFDEENSKVFVSMKRDTGERFMLKTLSELYVHGVDPSWENVHGSRGNVTDIPQYQFHPRSNLLIPEISRLSLMGGDSSSSGHPFLSPILGDKKTYKVMISPNKIGSVYEHFVMGNIIIPGAFYGEVGLAIADHITQGRVYQMSVTVEFKNPLALYPGQSQELDVSIRTEDDPKMEKERIVYTVTRDNQTLAVGSIVENSESGVKEPVDIEEIKDRCSDQWSSEDVYGELKRIGFAYGTPMRVLSNAVKNDEECVLYMRLSEEIRAERIGTYLHPAILDGMMQAVGVIVEGEGEGEILPVRIGNLEVRGTPQDFMVIYGKVVKITEVANHYDVTLLSPTGDIIAEARDIVTQKLGVVSNKKHMAFNIRWKPIQTLPMIEEVDYEEWSKFLILVKGSINSLPGSSVVQLNSDESIEEQLIHKEDLQSHRAIVYLSNVDHKRLKAADDIFEGVLEECLQIRELVLLILKKRVKCPLYLFTRNVWLLNHKKSPVDVDAATPSGAALWGMMRSISRELSDLTIKLVDISESEQMDTQSCLFSMVNFITPSDKDWLVDSEFAFSDGVIHSFEFSPTTESMDHNYKEVGMDENCEVKVYSQNKNDYVSPFLSYCRTPKPISSVDVALKVDTMSIQNSLLYSTCIESKIVSTHSHTGGFPVVCLEAIGYIKPDHPNEKFISCYPTQAGTTIIVPRSCLIAGDDLPHYSPGLMIKIVLMWSLCEGIRSPGVTVLYNTRTKALMQILSLMLASQKKLVQAVSTEDMGPIENEDIVSLVSLNKAAINEVIGHWANARCLSTVYSLIDNVSIAMIHDQLPRVSIQLLRTEEIYSPFMLLQNIPILAKWIENNRQELASICRSFKSGLLGRRRSSTTIPRSIDIMRLLSISEIPFSRGILLPPARAVTGNLFREDAVYIVVGGLTGLGWECVRFLADNGAGFVVCFNRRSPTEENLTNIQHLENTSSCRVAALQVDVTSYKSVQKGFNNIENIFPGSAVKGVIFGAAVLKDSFIENMDRQTFSTALSPKVRGAWNLHLATKNLNLDYFIMHSSVTSVLGNPGQTNYGAGNSFEDGLAHMRRAIGLPGQSLNWGPSDTGMLKQGGSTDKVVKLLTQQGYELLELDEIHHCLMTSLIDDHPQMMLSKFDLGNFSKGNAESHGLLAKFMEILPSNSSKAAGEDAPQDDGKRKLDIAMIKTLEKEERLEILEQYMSIIACKVFAVDESMVTKDSSMYDLGIDSMLAMTIIDQINKDTGVRIPMVLLLSEQSTIAKLAACIENNLLGDDGANPGTGTGTTLNLTEETTTKEKNVNKNLWTDGRPNPEEQENNKLLKDSTTKPDKENAVQEKVQKTMTNKKRNVNKITPSTKADNKTVMNSIASQKITPNLLTKENTASFIEKDMYELNQQLGDKSTLHFIKDIIFRGSGLDADMIRYCARQLLDRHPIAKTRFVPSVDDYQHLNRVIGESEPVIREVASSTDDKEYQRISLEGFDLRNYGPVRFVFSSQPSVRVRIVCHKIGFDSISVCDLVSTFQTLVVNKASNKETPDVFLQQTSGSCEIEDLFQKRKPKLTEFWRQQVAKSIPKIKFRENDSVKASPQTKDKVINKCLDQNTSKNILNFISRTDATLLDLFLSSYQLVLRCYSEDNSVVVMTRSNLRSHLNQDCDKVLNLTSEFPIFAKIRPSDTLSSFLESNTQVINSCFQNSVCPLSLIESFVTSEDSRENMKRHSVEQDEPRKTVPAKVINMTHDTLLTVRKVATTETIDLQFQYKTAAIGDGLAEKLVGQLQQVVLMVVTSPWATVGDVGEALGLVITEETNKITKATEMTDTQIRPDEHSTRTRPVQDTMKPISSSVQPGTLSYTEYYFYNSYLTYNHVAHHVFTDLVTSRSSDSEEIFSNVLLNLMRRHRCLRTTYVKAGPEEGFRFGYKKTEVNPEDIMDFQKVDSSKNDQEFERLTRLPFDLSVKGGARMIFAESPSTRVRVVFHHVCIDFHTFSWIVKDMADLIRHLEYGMDPPPSPSEQVETSAALVEKALQPLENQLREFWQESLKDGIPDLILQKSPTNPDRAGKVKAISEVLPKDLSEDILKLVPKLRTSVFRFFTAVQQIYFHFLTGEERVVISIATDLRLHLPEARRFYENMVNVLPIAVDFRDKEDTPVSALIKSHSQSILQHIAHGLYPNYLIQELIANPKDRQKPFKHSVVEEDVSTVNGINRKNYDVNLNPDLLGFSYETRLMVWLNKTTSYIKLVLECLPEMYPEAEVRTHLANIVKITRAVVKDETITLSQLKRLVVPEEKKVKVALPPSVILPEGEETEVAARCLKETSLGYDHMVYTKITKQNGRPEVVWSSIGYRGKSKPKIFKRLPLDEITNAYLATYRQYRTIVLETRKKKLIFKFIEKSEIAGFTRSLGRLMAERSEVNGHSVTV